MPGARAAERSFCAFDEEEKEEASVFVGVDAFLLALMGGALRFDGGGGGLDRGGEERHRRPRGRET
jgi:hypothetical protein